ncbi:hypothetical protein LNQ81_17910 [Myroides sp. M-43]|uniref:hypothetical protein n=1 Tax=Myroides oncorhynchi TaxID=2893756 RepID=UPI001E2E48B4|nr:hypothetical protein [Myroides oncorhynchi]MCC9044548.1 hypothetical protein [Myroides oncorhynchi]
MTIAQILKQIDNKTAIKVGKLPIREVEEEKKGHWVAYIDEGNDSHDVHIILKGKQVEQTQCDCGVNEEQICQHKGRLLMSIEDALKGKKIVDKPVVKKTLTKKKMSESVALLHEVNHEDVYGWLAELFKKNKDIEQEFVLTFGKVEVRDYTVEDVQKMMTDILKTTVGRKKEVDAQTVKKLVDLFTLALAPVNDYLLVNITKPIAIAIYVEILSKLHTFRESVYYTSSRMDTFEKKFIERFLHILFNVKDRGALEGQLTFIRTKLQSVQDNLETFILWKLFVEIETASDKDNLEFFISEIIALKDFYREHANAFSYNRSINRFLLNVIIRNELFDTYYHRLTPVMYDDEYNEYMIDRIVDIDLIYAEKFCIEIIEEKFCLFSNNDIKRTLAEIQQKLGKGNEALETQIDLFFKDINIKDYKSIMNNIKNIKQKKVFKAKVKEELRSMNLNGDRAEIYFEILHLDKEHKLMLDVIDCNIPLSLVFKYASKLYQVDAKLLLDRIMLLGQFPYRMFSKGGSKQEECVDFVLQKYKRGDIISKFSKYSAPSGSLNKLIWTKIVSKQ